MRVWDGFFGLVVLMNIIWTPLAIVFQETYHAREDTPVNWKAFDLFIEMLWAFAFFINLNRVDIIRKIITPRDTAYQYLRSPFLVPDALCLIVATACTISGDFREAHFIKLIRIFHFNEVLFPANLCV